MEKNNTEPQRIEALSWKDRMIQAAHAEGKRLGNPDDPAQLEYPLLWDWITSCFGGEGFVKNPGKLSIQAVQGGVTITLLDMDLACSIDVSVEMLDDVFKALEKALGSPSPNVRTFSKKEPKLKKLKKKKEEEE